MQEMQNVAADCVNGSMNVTTEKPAIGSKGAPATMVLLKTGCNGYVVIVIDSNADCLTFSVTNHESHDQLAVDSIFNTP
ncbi:unnamed protein product [Ceratitis capitata]|uniref:(Mediterranean fruit fly) hypothetical protein n=1 Tax=Ceratitis capitata TaxID=7213 RepID=A0A811VJN8_CERCA|nr:unnamed protein product [Ceratitis capitata]